MNKLIKLAKEKGFISHFNKEWKYSSKESLRQLFELTELQQWLKEKHNIIVEPLHITMGTLENIQYYCAIYDFKHHHYMKELNAIECSLFDEHELALQQGLLEALKLI